METVLEPLPSQVSFEPRTSTRRSRNYSDAEKAKTLATLDLCNGNLSETSRRTGVPLTTILDWRDGKIPDDVSELRDNKRRELADRFEDLAHLYITQATNTFDASKGTQAITGAGIAVDKMRLLRGESTVNVAITAQAQVLHKWIETHNPPLAEIEEYIELTADAQNVNANELRTALDALSSKPMLDNVE